MPKIPGVNHLDAVRVLEEAGFRVVRQGKHIVMSDGVGFLTIPRADPVNACTMDGIARVAADRCEAGPQPGAEVGPMRSRPETINRIRNCRVRFRKVCPETWERLSSTSDREMRFCATCNREVFLCETDAEALEHAQAGHCIAKPMLDSSGPAGARAMLVGMPEVPPPQPTREERLLMKEYSREVAKTRALQDLEFSSRTCPRCSYPCKDWLTACGVCGLEVGRHRASS